MRLIDADALRDALGITGTADSCKGCKYNDRFEFACNTDAAPTFEYVCEMIDDAPTIEERKGKWINNIHDIPICDQCGYMTPYDRAIDDYEYGNYCPNCGADMRKQP